MSSFDLSKHVNKVEILESFRKILINVKSLNHEVSKLKSIFFRGLSTYLSRIFDQSFYIKAKMFTWRVVLLDKRLTNLLIIREKNLFTCRVALLDKRLTNLLIIRQRNPANPEMYIFLWALKRRMWVCIWASRWEVAAPSCRLKTII